MSTENSTVVSRTVPFTISAQYMPWIAYISKDTCHIFVEFNFFIFLNWIRELYHNCYHISYFLRDIQIFAFYGQSDRLSMNQDEKVLLILLYRNLFMGCKGVCP